MTRPQTQTQTQLHRIGTQDPTYILHRTQSPPHDVSVDLTSSRDAAQNQTHDIHVGNQSCRDESGRTFHTATSPATAITSATDTATSAPILQITTSSNHKLTPPVTREKTPPGGSGVRDGVVDKDELRRQRLFELFVKYDHDKSGRLDISEVSQVCVCVCVRAISEV